MPNPLDAKIGGQYIDIDSVAKDKSYLISFLEHGDAGSGDVHVNFRGYPGHTAIPRCTTVIPNGTKTIRGKTACFADTIGARTAPGIKATVYRVNQDADQWHILLAWKHKGSLYTVSEHVIKPYDNSTVVLKNLDAPAAQPRPRSATGLMRLTRRSFLGGAAAAAVGGAGIYELVDRLTPAPHRPAAGPMPREQHVFDLRSVQSEGVEVLVPPLHSEIVTATIKSDDLRAAQHDLEAALQDLDAQYTPDPSGLGVTIAWGLPYFDERVARQAKAHLPFDHRAGKSVLLPSRRFPSDPHATILERNDVAVLLRSDSREHIDAARKAIFEDLGLFTPTSIRRGFAGGGFDGKQSLPKKMAMAAGVAGADLIPDTSELFLGFTSTQKAGLGPRLIANHETLGYVDLRDGYFHGGTHMHLSHISEDLEAWYLNFDFDERVLTSFRTGLTNVKQGAQTVPQGPKDVSTRTELDDGYKKTGRFGHSASIQTTSRLAAGRGRA